MLGSEKQLWKRVASSVLSHILSEPWKKKLTPMDERKLLVVIGITGNQGGSVARTFLNDPGMMSKYRLRGIFRHPFSGPSRELAAQGVEMVGADLHDPPSLLKAFEGAYVIFSVTDFWAPYLEKSNQVKAKKQGKQIDHLSYELEYEQGRNIVDVVFKI